MNHVCLSAFLLETGNDKDAEKEGLLAEQQCKARQDERGLLYALSSLGDVYLKQGKYDKAILYFNNFLNTEDKAGDPYMIAQVKQKKANVLIEQKKYHEAIPLLDESMKVFVELNTIKEIKDGHLFYHRINKAMGNFETALTHLEKANQLRDTLFRQEKTKEVLKLEARYQNQTKEAENIRLQAQQAIKDTTIKSQRNYMMGGVLSLLLVSLLSFFLYRQKQKQTILNQSLSNQKDQISLLNRELNHRVKNNLAFMTSLLEMQGRRAENEETKQLLKESESRLKTLALVHTSLFKKEDSNFINLNEYLSQIVLHLQHYFELPDKKLKIVTNFIHHEVDAEDAMRLGLIVNELVTNSVKHAFGKIDDPQITITTSANEDGRIVLEYGDNGAGPSKISGDNSRGAESLGMKLIDLLRKQLKQNYLLKLNDGNFNYSSEIMI